MKNLNARLGCRVAQAIFFLFICTAVLLEGAPSGTVSSALAAPQVGSLPVAPKKVIELPKLTLSESENVVTVDIRQIQRMLKKGEVLEIELLTKEKKSYAGALADFYALADKFCHLATISDDMALAQQCSPTTTSRGLQEWSSAISYLSGIALGVRPDSRAAASYAAFVRSNPGVVYLIEKGRAVFPMTVKDLQGLLYRTVRMSNALAIEFDGCLFPQKASGNQLSKVCRSALPVPPLSIVHDKDKLVLSRQASRDASVYVQISTRERNVKKANPVANVPVNVQCKNCKDKGSSSSSVSSSSSSSSSSSTTSTGSTSSTSSSVFSMSPSSESSSSSLTTTPRPTVATPLRYDTSGRAIPEPNTLKDDCLGRGDLCFDHRGIQYHKISQQVAVPTPAEGDYCRSDLFLNVEQCADSKFIFYYKIANGCVKVGVSSLGWTLSCPLAAMLKYDYEEWNKNIVEIAALLSGHSSTNGQYIPKYVPGVADLMNQIESVAATWQSLPQVIRPASGTSKTILSDSAKSAKLRLLWSGADTLGQGDQQSAALLVDNTAFYSYLSRQKSKIFTEFDQVAVSPLLPIPPTPTISGPQIVAPPKVGGLTNPILLTGGGFTPAKTSKLQFINPSDRALCLLHTRIPTALAYRRGLPHRLRIPAKGEASVDLRADKITVFAKRGGAGVCRDKAEKMLQDSQQSTLFELAYSMYACEDFTKTPLRQSVVPVGVNIVEKVGQTADCDWSGLTPVLGGSPQVERNDSPNSVIEKADHNDFADPDDFPPNRSWDTSPVCPGVNVPMVESTSPSEEEPLQCECPLGSVPNPNPIPPQPGDVYTGEPSCMQPADGDGGGGSCPEGSYSEQEDYWDDFTGTWKKRNICKCYEGYAVAANALTYCTEIPKCLPWLKVNANLECEHRCLKNSEWRPDPANPFSIEPGSGNCHCQEGFMLDPAKEKCVPIPKCEGNQVVNRKTGKCEPPCLVPCPVGTWTGTDCRIKITCFSSPSSNPSSPSSSSASSVSSNTSTTSSGNADSGSSVAARTPSPTVVPTTQVGQGVLVGVGPYQTPHQTPLPPPGDCSITLPPACNPNDQRPDADGNSGGEVTPPGGGDSDPGTVLPPVGGGDGTNPPAGGGVVNPPTDSGDVPTTVPAVPEVYGPTLPEDKVRLIREGARTSDPQVPDTVPVVHKNSDQGKLIERSIKELSEVLRTNQNDTALKELTRQLDAETDLDKKLVILEKIQKRLDELSFGKKDFDTLSNEEAWKSKVADLRGKFATLVRASLNNGFWKTLWSASRWGGVPHDEEVAMDQLQEAITESLKYLLSQRSQLTPEAYTRALKLILSISQNGKPILGRNSEAILENAKQVSAMAGIVSRVSRITLLTIALARSGGQPEATALIVGALVYELEYLRMMKDAAIESGMDWDKYVELHAEKDDEELQKKAFESALIAFVATETLLRGGASSVPAIQKAATLLGKAVGYTGTIVVTVELVTGISKLVEGITKNDENLQKEGWKSLGDAGIDAANFGAIIKGISRATGKKIVETSIPKEPTKIDPAEIEIKQQMSKLDSELHTKYQELNAAHTSEAKKIELKAEIESLNRKFEGYRDQLDPKHYSSRAVKEHATDLKKEVEGANRINEAAFKDSGSRGNGVTGYFEVTFKDANGNVTTGLAYRGAGRMTESGAVIRFLTQIQSSGNSKLSAFFPKLLGVTYRDGLSYVVMEKLVGYKATQPHSSLADVLSSAFYNLVSRHGVNIDTAFEADYLFIDPNTGTVRMGIPYRAMDFLDYFNERFSGMKYDPYRNTSTPRPAVVAYEEVKKLLNDDLTKAPESLDDFKKLVEGNQSANKLSEAELAELHSQLLMEKKLYEPPKEPTKFTTARNRPLSDAIAFPD